MNSVWSMKWKKCLIWFSAYMSVIAFAVLGGYVIVKNDDEELKKSTKLAFIVSLVFAAISGVLSIFYNFASMAHDYYSSGASDFYSIATSIVAVAKILVFAFILVMLLIQKEPKENE